MSRPGPSGWAGAKWGAEAWQAIASGTTAVWNHTKTALNTSFEEYDQATSETESLARAEALQTSVHSEAVPGHVLGLVDGYVVGFERQQEHQSPKDQSNAHGADTTIRDDSVATLAFAGTIVDGRNKTTGTQPTLKMGAATEPRSKAYQQVSSDGANSDAPCLMETSSAQPHLLAKASHQNATIPELKTLQRQSDNKKQSPSQASAHVDSIVGGFRNLKPKETTREPQQAPTSQPEPETKISIAETKRDTEVEQTSERTGEPANELDTALTENAESTAVTRNTDSVSLLPASAAATEAPDIGAFINLANKTETKSEANDTRNAMKSQGASGDELDQNADSQSNDMASSSPSNKDVPIEATNLANALEERMAQIEDNAAVKSSHIPAVSIVDHDRLDDAAHNHVETQEASLKAAQKKASPKASKSGLEHDAKCNYEEIVEEASNTNNRTAKKKLSKKKLAKNSGPTIGTDEIPVSGNKEGALTEVKPSHNLGDAASDQSLVPIPHEPAPSDVALEPRKQINEDEIPHAAEKHLLEAKAAPLLNADEITQAEGQLDKDQESDKTSKTDGDAQLRPPESKSPQIILASSVAATASPILEKSVSISSASQADLAQSEAVHKEGDRPYQPEELQNITSIDQSRAGHMSTLAAKPNMTEAHKPRKHKSTPKCWHNLPFDECKECDNCAHGVEYDDCEKCKGLCEHYTKWDECMVCIEKYTGSDSDDGNDMEQEKCIHEQVIETCGVCKETEEVEQVTADVEDTESEEEVSGIDEEEVSEGEEEDVSESEEEDLSNSEEEEETEDDEDNEDESGDDDGIETVMRNNSQTTEPQYPGERARDLNLTMCEHNQPRKDCQICPTTESGAVKDKAKPRSSITEEKEKFEVIDEPIRFTECVHGHAPNKCGTCSTLETSTFYKHNIKNTSCDQYGHKCEHGLIVGECQNCIRATSTLCAHGSAEGECKICQDKCEHHQSRQECGICKAATTRKGAESCKHSESRDTCTKCRSECRDGQQKEDCETYAREAEAEKPEKPEKPERCEHGLARHECSICEAKCKHGKDIEHCELCNDQKTEEANNHHKDSEGEKCMHGQLIERCGLCKDLKTTEEDIQNRQVVTRAQECIHDQLVERCGLCKDLKASQDGGQDHDVEAATKQCVHGQEIETCGFCKDLKAHETHSERQDADSNKCIHGQQIERCGVCKDLKFGGNNGGPAHEKLSECRHGREADSCHECAAYDNAICAHRTTRKECKECTEEGEKPCKHEKSKTRCGECFDKCRHGQIWERCGVCDFEAHRNPQDPTRKQCDHEECSGRQHCKYQSDKIPVEGVNDKIAVEQTGNQEHHSSNQLPFQRLDHSTNDSQSDERGEKHAEADSQTEKIEYNDKQPEDSKTRSTQGHPGALPYPISPSEAQRHGKQMSPQKQHAPSEMAISQHAAANPTQPSAHAPEGTPHPTQHAMPPQHGPSTPPIPHPPHEKAYEHPIFQPQKQSAKPGTQALHALPSLPVAAKIQQPQVSPSIDGSILPQVQPQTPYTAVGLPSVPVVAQSVPPSLDGAKSQAIKALSIAQAPASAAFTPLSGQVRPMIPAGQLAASAAITPLAGQMQPTTPPGQLPASAAFVPPTVTAQPYVPPSLDGSHLPATAVFVPLIPTQQPYVPPSLDGSHLPVTAAFVPSVAPGQPLVPPSLDGTSMIAGAIDPSTAPGEHEKHWVAHPAGTVVGATAVQAPPEPVATLPAALKAGPKTGAPVIAPAAVVQPVTSATMQPMLAQQIIKPHSVAPAVIQSAPIVQPQPVMQPQSITPAALPQPLPVQAIVEPKSVPAAQIPPVTQASAIIEPATVTPAAVPKRQKASKSTTGAKVSKATATPAAKPPTSKAAKPASKKAAPAAKAKKSTTSKVKNTALAQPQFDIYGRPLPSAAENSSMPQSFSGYQFQNNLYEQQRRIMQEQQQQWQRSQRVAWGQQAEESSEDDEEEDDDEESEGEDGESEEESEEEEELEEEIEEVVENVMRNTMGMGTGMNMGMGGYGGRMPQMPQQMQMQMPPQMHGYGQQGMGRGNMSYGGPYGTMPGWPRR